MLSALIKHLLLTCLLVLVGFLLNPGVIRADDLAGYPKEILHIQFTAMDRLQNGQTVQRFTVHPPRISTGPVTLLYLENQDPVIYKATPVKQCYAIQVHKTSNIRIFAFAQDQQKSYVTCTDLVLFGKSKIPAKRIPASISESVLLRGLPHIALNNSDRHYWHQTGVPLTFSLVTASQTLTPTVMKLFKNNNTTTLVPEIAQPYRFLYTPPHDKRLRQSSLTATRQDLLFTQVEHNGKQYHLAYALRVHRSRHAHDNHKAGAVTLAAGTILFIGVLLNKRKKPWWKE